MNLDCIFIIIAKILSLQKLRNKDKIEFNINVYRVEHIIMLFHVLHLDTILKL